MRDRNPPNPPQPAGDVRRWATLVARGDKSAFERLYRRFRPGLLRLLLKRCGGRTEQAEELSQKTWMETWRAVRAGRYDPQQAAFSTFLYAVGYKVWLQHRRAARTGSINAEPELLESLPQRAPDGGEDPADRLAACELLEAMRACLHETSGECGLTDEERQIVVAIANGDSERALADNLRVAASTIHARKMRAYEKLRRCLAAKGFAGRDAERGPLERG